MKIRTDFVTNSSSSSYVAMVTVYTSDNQSVTMEGKDKDPYRALVLGDDTDTNAWFNEEITDVFNCKSVDTLVAFLYNSIHGQGLMKSKDPEKDSDLFSKKLKGSAKSIDDIRRVAFIRKYSGWGDSASCYVINDEELMDLYNAYMKSGSVEDKEKLVTYLNGVHPASIWQGHTFGESPAFDYVGYFWAGNTSLESLPHLDFEYGFEFREIDLKTHQLKSFAVLDLDQRVDDEVIFNEIRRRVDGKQIGQYEIRNIFSKNGRTIRFTEGVYEHLTKLINKSGLEVVLSRLNEVGLSKYCDKCGQTEDLLVTLKYLADTQSVISHEGEMILLVKYLSGEETELGLFSNLLKYTVGSISVLADKSITDSNGFSTVYEELQKAAINKKLDIIRKELSAKQQAVHMIAREDLDFREYEKIQNALNKFQILSIVRNRFTGRFFLLIKNPKKKAEFIPIETMDSSIMKCVPDYHSEILGDTAIKMSSVATELFCLIENKDETRPVDTGSQKYEKIPVKTAGTGYKVRVRFPDKKSFLYNCYESVEIGTRVFVGGKNSNVPGVIEEIAGPADSRPYMQKVEYILADHGEKDNSALNSVKTKKFVQSADSAVYVPQAKEKFYTNVHRQEAWYLEVIKIRFNLLSLKQNCLKEKIIVMDSHLKGDLYDVIHALLDYCGAVYKISVTKKTEYCVVSEEYKNGGTGNSDRAIRYRKQGVPLEILTTDEFFALLRKLSS